MFVVYGGVFVVCGVRGGGRAPVDGGGGGSEVHTAEFVVYFALVCSGTRPLARTKWLVSGTNIVSFAMKHLTSAFSGIFFPSTCGFGTMGFSAGTKMLLG